MAALFVIDTRQTTPYALADLFRTCPLPTPFFLCAQNDIAGDDYATHPSSVDPMRNSLYRVTGKDAARAK